MHLKYSDAGASADEVTQHACSFSKGRCGRSRTAMAGQAGNSMNTNCCGVVLLYSLLFNVFAGDLPLATLYGLTQLDPIAPGDANGAFDVLSFLLKSWISNRQP